MAEMFTLTVAGHETTASTLTFLTYELAKHPEYQTRLRKEIQDRRALVMSRGDTNFSMEDLDSLALTMNAIKVRPLVMDCIEPASAANRLPHLQETLRFHPIVTGLPRVATKDDVIPLAYPIISTTGEAISEILVRAGQIIFPSFMAYQRYVVGSFSDPQVIGVRLIAPLNQSQGYMGRGRGRVEPRPLAPSRDREADERGGLCQLVSPRAFTHIHRVLTSPLYGRMSFCKCPRV